MSEPTASLPKRFPDRHTVADVRAEAEPLDPAQEGEKTRRLAGRVLGRRGHGQARLPRPRRPLGADPAALLGRPRRAGRPRPRRHRRGRRQADEDASAASRRSRSTSSSSWRRRRPLPGHVPRARGRGDPLPQRYLDLLVNEETRRDFLLRSAIVARSAATWTTPGSSRSRRPSSSHATAAPSRSPS